MSARLYYDGDRDLSASTLKEIQALAEVHDAEAHECDQAPPQHTPWETEPEEEAKIRLVIAGSRTFTDYPLLCNKLERITSSIGLPNLVISGTARGGDQMGERWAAEHGIPVKRMPADWNKFGKRAGFLRNEAMAAVATHVVSFIVSGSKGAAMMAAIAKKAGLPTRAISV